MKKLMIAAAVVCAAAFAHAAAATWTWSTSAAPKAPAVDLANLVAGHVGAGSSNLKAMNAVTWTYVMTLSNDSGQSDELSGSLAWSVNNISVKNLSSDVMWKPGEATDPENIVDYSIVITGTYKDAKGVDWTFTSDPIADQAKFASTSTLQLKTGGPSGWTVTSSAVPEPTSGLLLLLGVAGLALRRRRA